MSWPLVSLIGLPSFRNPVRISGPYNREQRKREDEKKFI
jgi:hypothetical protein